jgi:phosphoribosylglycinamide formyltransferase-1
VVLSGLMRLVPPEVVDAFSPYLINTHPAYLPEFPGAHGVRDALAAGVTETGASLIVVDNSVDGGPIIAQERIPVLPDDTESSLHDRIKPVERRLLIQAVLDIANAHLDLKELARS